MVLFVDDDPTILDLYRALARKIPHKTALCPSQALTMLGAEKFRVIVTDNQMPAMSGSRFIGRARQQCPEAVFIMVSSSPPSSFCDAERPATIMTKPFDILALRRHLSQGLNVA